MKLYLLLVTLTVVNAGVVPDAKCDGVTFDGKYYDKEILKTGLSHPFHLAIDYSTNTLYFSYFIRNRTTAIRLAGLYFRSALFDLNTKQYKDINDVPNGAAQAVDQNTHDVYIGGNNGIYKYDHKNHKSELYAAENKNINNIIFFKNVLYFTELPFKSMYTYVNGSIARFRDSEDFKTNNFVIDGEDETIYSYSTKLYAQKEGEDAVLYSDELFVKAITVDVHGNAYMCTRQAIYKMDKKNTSLQKLMDTGSCCGLAFDSDNNMIYSDDDKLIRLKFNEDKKC